jgi:hypothetical protein
MPDKSSVSHLRENSEAIRSLIFDTSVGAALAGLETQARAMAAKCNLDSVRASMRNNGFLGVFNNDGDLLRRYAGGGGRVDV